MDETGEEDIFQKHIDNLKTRCRVCSDQFKGRSYKKGTFKDVFLSFFGVDIDNDEEHIHPPCVCDRHRKVLNRIREAADQGRQYSTNTTVHDFQAHGEACNLCLSKFKYHDHIYGGASPSKKQKRKHPGGPGRKKAVSTVPQAGASSSSTESHPPKTTEEEIAAKFVGLPVEEKKNCIRTLIGVMVPEDRQYLAQELGHSQATDMLQNAIEICSTYKSLSKLADYNVNHFLGTSNKVVLSFISGCCNFQPADGRKNYLLGLTMEMLFKLRYPSCIAPLSFMRNLTTYIGHDKSLVMKINGASSPGGSYTTVTDWVKGLDASPPMCPQGDIINVFDNDQVVGKTYKVRPDNKVHSSVITNCAWIAVSPEGSLQTREELMPGKWLGPENEEAVKKVATRISLDDQNDEEFKALGKTHRQQLAFFLDVAIREVVEEQQLKDDTFQDLIDDAVEASKTAATYQTCSKCKSLVLRSKRRCTNPYCGVNLKEARASTSAEDPSERIPDGPSISIEDRMSTSSIPVERYSHVPHNHPSEPPLVTIADPVFVNPNSFDTLTTVLRKIGSDAGIVRYGGEKRHWTVVCCDGLPYHLVMKLIQQTYICSTCKMSVFGHDVIRRHVETKCVGAQTFREFDWVLLKIGGGHREMNMCKSFMELNWDPFMSDFCRVLSFRSPFAQQSAKRCDDHHKTWALLLTFFLATLKELVVGYVRNCLKEQRTPTPTGFKEFADQQEHTPNFYYMYSQVTKFCLAIVNFRMGVRRNNSQLVKSANHAFKSMFHGRRHPIYAIIEVNDALIRTLAPAPIREFIEAHESISKSGDNSKGQDADFILEETNRETKVWIPRGVPDDNMWQQVCRNLPNLKSITQKMLQLSDISQTSDQGYRPLDVDAGVHAWRIRLRETQYLIKQERHHTTITGDPLHHDLVSFKRLAEGKRANHISALFNETVEEDTNPVFITEKEAQEALCIEGQTVAEIKKRICQDIQSLIEGDGDRAYFLTKYRTKSKRKAELVKLFYEIQNHGQQQVLPAQVTDFD